MDYAFAFKDAKYDSIPLSICGFMCVSDMWYHSRVGGWAVMISRWGNHIGNAGYPNFISCHST